MNLSIQSLLDWDGLRRDLETAIPYLDQSNRILIKEVWVGASRELAPSGKTWDPWNDEACKVDLHFWETFEKFVSDFFKGKAWVEYRQGEIFFVESAC